MTEQDEQQCPLSAEAGAALLWIERSIAPQSGSAGRIVIGGSVQGKQNPLYKQFLFVCLWMESAPQRKEREGRKDVDQKMETEKETNISDRGARYLTGENLEVVWVEFSTLS
jgi:hypothetical protein